MISILRGSEEVEGGYVCTDAFLAIDDLFALQAHGWSVDLLIMLRSSSHSMDSL